MLAESSDPGTELAIVDMLCYSLERAEKNLPHKRKVFFFTSSDIYSFAFFFFFLELFVLKDDIY